MSHSRLDDMPDYSAPLGDDFEPLARDSVLVRSLEEADVDAIARIDARVTGQDRRAYLGRKVAEVIHESGVRISLVGEMDEHVVGFVMARVDYGEFGQTDTTAIVDTIGVDPGHAREHVGAALMSQLLRNLSGLGVETVRTEIGLEERALAAFLAECGFQPAQMLALTRRL